MRQQLTFIRQAARVGEAEDVLSVADMAEILLEQGYPLRAVAHALAEVIPTQGNVGPLDRLKEMLEVTRGYTPDFLVFARKHGATWSSLLEPAVWWRNGEVEREEVESFFREWMDQHPRWPKVSTVRQRFGKAPTRRPKGDTPGQEVLA